MLASLKCFLNDESGGSVFDYAIISAAFALGVLATMTLVGNEASNQLSSTQSRLTNAASFTVGTGD